MIIQLGDENRKSNVLRSSIFFLQLCVLLSQESPFFYRAGGGSNPRWNETFKFKAVYPFSKNQQNLFLNFMDKDTFSADDFVGTAKYAFSASSFFLISLIKSNRHIYCRNRINVRDLIDYGAELGYAELPPQRYRVVLKDLTYSGDVRVGVTFRRKVLPCRMQLL